MALPSSPTIIRRASPMPSSTPSRAGIGSPHSTAVTMPDYAAHPFLDPELFHKDRHALRYFRRLFRDSLRNDWQYRRLLNRLLHPTGDESALEVDERVMSSYCEDASRYVSELLGLLPSEQHDRYGPMEEVASCNDLRQLGSLLFTHDADGADRARRIRFEAQRKLYLTKLLIQIEHTRMVQDGPRHRRYLIELLDKEFWSFVTGVRDDVASYTLDPEQDVARPNGDDLESWNFRVKTVHRAIPGGEIAVDVYHFDTRFKKETAGYEYRPGDTEYRVAERTRFSHMKRNRSASILSKMLRKGINNPNGITDMLGAKFIVESKKDVHQLAELLHHTLGGMFLFRNQVDLFRRPEDREMLNRFSAPDFRTFKEDVDILYRPVGQEHGRAYLFSVELQIFTVESFLQTVHSQAYASHREYKRRQFLEGVMPYVFPAVVYGELNVEPTPVDGEAA